MIVIFSFFKFRNNHPDVTGHNCNEKLFYINKIKRQFLGKGCQVNDFFKSDKSFICKFECFAKSSARRK